MTRGRGVACALAIAAALPFAMTRDAAANGAFPSSGQIVIDPSDAARIGVRTTYGLVATTDGGSSFHWTCEAALGYSESEHPQMGVTSLGTVFAGLLNGMVRGRLGGCEWDRVPSLEGQAVLDVSFSPGGGRAIAAVLSSRTEGRGEVWASVDDAATWSKLGSLLPVKFFPITLDAAPSDPDRLYASGLVSGSDVRGAVAFSRDAGETWDLAFVPDADSSKAPYIGGVDPLDPDVVWVRLDAAPGELLVSRDGGETWDVALLTDGFLRAFALSPDGSEVIAGGDLDGLARADAIDLDWSPMTPVAARCVRWTDEAIDACGTEAVDGFTMGRSTDDGATFVPFYSQACLEGPEACGAATPVGACADAWPAVRGQIGAVGCSDGGSGPAGPAAQSASGGGAGPEASGGPASATSGSATSAAGTSVDGWAAGGHAADDGTDHAGEGSGCSCRSTPERGAVSIAPGLALLLVAWGAARKRGRTGHRFIHRAGRRR